MIPGKTQIYIAKVIDRLTSLCGPLSTKMTCHLFSGLCPSLPLRVSRAVFYQCSSVLVIGHRRWELLKTQIAVSMSWGAGFVLSFDNTLLHVDKNQKPLQRNQNDILFSFKSLKSLHHILKTLKNSSLEVLYPSLFFSQFFVACQTKIKNYCGGSQKSYFTPLNAKW